MSKTIQRRLRGLFAEERGQVLPFVAVAMLVLVGMAGLTIDVGRVYYSNRGLQEMSDSAALAGAGTLNSATTSGQVVSAANAMSGTTGSTNARASMPNVTMSSGYPALKCLTTLQNQGIACAGSVPYNAVQVQEQITVPMYFASLFGVKTMTTTVSSVAAGRGGAPSPYNIAVIIDTTLSMAAPDSNCGSTQILCALSGVQALLRDLSPCAASLSTCSINNGASANSVDRVALFTFPNMSTGTYTRDTNCTTAVPSPSSGNGYYSTVINGGIVNYIMPQSPYGQAVTPWSTIPVAMSYSFPSAGAVSYSSTTSYNATSPSTTGTATYQVTPFLSDYRTANLNKTLNANSDLVQAAGGVSSCGGMAPPNYAGVYGTYYAGSIYAAQAALTAEKALFPGSANAIIILGDGDNNAPQTNGPYQVMGSPATSNGTYPSYLGQCGQAVTAAQYATSQGTRVYSVAYGSQSTGCTTDALAGAYPGITPCQTMANLASATQYFYSDYQQSGSFSNCVSGQPVTSLSGIFSAIAGNLSTPRLIPSGTT